MSSGQIVTGLTVGGALTFELAKESPIDAFLSSAMLNDWEIFTLQTLALSIDVTDPANRTLSRTTGSFMTDGYVPGQLLTLSGFTDPINNTQIMIAEIISATVARFVGPEDMSSGSGVTTGMRRCDRLQIGTKKKSFTMEKKFLDLDQKAIIYRGMLVGEMELNISFGELIGGSFTFSGNDYRTIASDVDSITVGETIAPAATTPTLNGSIDMPFLATSAIGELDSTGLDIQSVSLTLNNNLSAQNVIGDIAPRDYSPGTAAIAVSLNAYLKDGAWALLAKKLSQASFGVAFMVRNEGGFYGFQLPAVQVSFDDPSSGGQNQDISLEMSGTAKVGNNGESALVIYRG